MGHLNTVGRRLAESSSCHCCEGQQEKMMNFCLGCNRVLCNPCSGTNFDRMAPVMLCSTCMAARLAASVDSDASDEEAKSARDIAKRLSAVLQTVLARRTRAATRAQYRAGIAKLMDFGRSTHLNVLPSTPDVIWGFIMHMLVVQNLIKKNLRTLTTLRAFRPSWAPALWQWTGRAR